MVMNWEHLVRQISFYQKSWTERKLTNLIGLEYKTWEHFRYTLFSYCLLDNRKAPEQYLKTKNKFERMSTQSTLWLKFMTRFLGFCSKSEVGHSLGCHIHLLAPDRVHPEFGKHQSSEKQYHWKLKKTIFSWKKEAFLSSNFVLFLYFFPSGWYSTVLPG